MIILITGVPGSGKSLLSISKILEYQKEGRAVYADIEGLNIPNVLPSPADWRDTPEGSVVIYDECQKIFPSTGKAGVADDDRMRAMETHRHTGHDLIFITQAPTFVHHHIRKLVGKHHHCYRAMGLQGCTIFTWDGICDSPNGYHERKQADSKRWTYPKELFQYYKSATVHTHKFKIPTKLLVMCGAAVLLIGLALTFFFNSDLEETISGSANPISGAMAQSAPAPDLTNTEYTQPHLNDIHLAKPVTVTISGCVAGIHCRCFDQSGIVLDLKDNICRSFAAGLLALPIQIPGGGSKEQSTAK